MIYLHLFISFFQIGLFSFGGGYSAMPLIRNQVVDYRQWISLTEFTDLITISQMTPGPIAINSATFVGLRVAGFSGALVATAGCVLPSCLVVSILAYLYYKYRGLLVMQGVLDGLRAAVVALIASAGISILLVSLWGGDLTDYSIKELDYSAGFIFAGAMFVLLKKKPDPVLVILGSGLVGILFYFL